MTPFFQHFSMETLNTVMELLHRAQTARLVCKAWKKQTDVILLLVPLLKLCETEPKNLYTYPKELHKKLRKDGDLPQETLATITLGRFLLECTGNMMRTKPKKIYWSVTNPKNKTNLLFSANMQLSCLYNPTTGINLKWLFDLPLLTALAFKIFSSGSANKIYVLNKETRTWMSEKPFFTIQHGGGDSPIYKKYHKSCPDPKLYFQFAFPREDVVKCYYKLLRQWREGKRYDLKNPRRYITKKKEHIKWRRHTHWITYYEDREKYDEITEENENDIAVMPGYYATDPNHCDMCSRALEENA